MKITKCLTLAAIAITFIMTGCNFSVGTNTATANSSNASNSKPATNAASPAPAANKTESTSSGSLATPTEAYKTAYEYRKKKDIEGLKKVLSKDVMDFMTEMSKDDGKTLDDALKELCDRPQAEKPEVRNEKIDGNHASIEVTDEKGEWGPIDFEKFGNDWKMTIPKAPNKGGSGPKKP